MPKKSLFILLVIMALLAAACDSGQQSAANPTAAPEKTAVTVQLSWEHTIEFSGFYMAESKGYFSEEALTVTLNPGGYDAEGNFIDSVAAVTSGQAQFGVVEAAVLLRAREAGTPIVALASIYQIHPQSLVSLADKGIARPADLIGKTVSTSPDSLVVYRAMMASQGLDETQVNWVERSDFTINPLVNGEVDVIDGWVTNEVVTLTMGGYEINNILPSEYGINFYPNVIFTTEETLNNRPDLVEHFVRATVRGLQAAVADPNDSAELSVSYNANLDKNTEIEAMNRSIALISPTGSEPGMMSTETWEYMYQTLLDANVLTKEQDVTQAYSLTSLDQFYANK